MLRRVCNILLAVILLCGIALTAILGIPLVMGNKLFAVLTSSMEPAYPVGSIVVVKPLDAENVKVDDVITFSVEGFEDMVTHRVVEVKSGDHQLITKGDNNDNVDFFSVDFKDVHGRVEYGIPYLGTLVSGLRTTGGVLIALWVVLIILMLLFVPDIVDKIKGTKSETIDKDDFNNKNRRKKNTKQTHTVYRAGSPGEKGGRL